MAPLNARISGTFLAMTCTEVLFIFSGAFTGMNDIIKNRVGAPQVDVASTDLLCHRHGVRYQIHGILGR